MKYIAVFDIPDNYVIGCALAKICPNDGKVRCDSDFETVYANTVRMDEYTRPKLMEVPFYRDLVIDHMEAAGVETKGMCYDYREPEDVKKRMKSICAAKTKAAEMLRNAFYVGQLSLLDYIQQMQDEYVVMSGKK